MDNQHNFNENDGQLKVIESVTTIENNDTQLGTFPNVVKLGEENEENSATIAKIDENKKIIEIEEEEIYVAEENILNKQGIHL